MISVTSSDIQALLHSVEDPHVDLGPMLGLRTQLHLGVDDLTALLQTGEPSFRLDVGDAAVTVRRQDGSWLCGLTVRF